MDIFTLLEACRKYQELGSAVQKQLHQVAVHQNFEDQNSNALEMISEFLSYVCGQAQAEDDQELEDQTADLFSEIRNYLDGELPE